MVVHKSKLGAIPVEFRPNPTKQTFLLRLWRQSIRDDWHYTVVIPDVKKRHHFKTLADATTFIDTLMR